MMGLFSKKKRSKEEPIDVSDEKDVENSVVQEEPLPESPRQYEDSPNAVDDYAEFTPQRTDGLMGPEEENRSFGINLTSKLLFLLGTILYLIMAVEDFQWVQSLKSTPAATTSGTQPADEDLNLQEFLASFGENDTESNGANTMTQVASIKDGDTRARRGLQGGVVNWYSNHYWDELPEVIQEQAALLGYNQELWDNASPVYTDRLFWDELTPAQQVAATNVFGYTEVTWNDYVTRFMASETTAPTESPITAPEEDPVEEPEEVPDEVPKEEETGDFDSNPVEPGKDVEETENTEEIDLTDESDIGEDIVATMSPTEEDDGDVFPPKGSASMIINTGGGYSGAGSEAHAKKYQILYCLAAACFILVGILDAKREKLGYHVIMVFAGVFGVLSGGLILNDEFVSSVCHSLSVHFFFIQALLIIYNRLPVVWDPVVRKFLWVADFLFVASTLLSIVLSYLYFNGNEEMNVAMATTAIMAAIFWCHTGIIYLAVTIMFWRSNKRSDKEMFDEKSVGNSCSVVPNDDGEMDIVYDGPNQGAF